MKKLNLRILMFSTIICLCASSQVFSQEDLNFDLPDASVFDVPAPAATTSEPAVQNTAPVQNTEVPNTTVSQPTVNETQKTETEPSMATPVQSTDIPVFEQPIPAVEPASVASEPEVAPSVVEPVSAPVSNVSAPVPPQPSNNVTKPWIQRGWGVNASFGSNLFYGDIRIYDLWPAKKYNNERKWAGSLMLEKELVPYLDLRGQVLYGTLSGTKRKYDSGAPANLYFDASLLELNTNIKFNLVNAIIGREAAFSVYGYAGMGFTFFRTERKDLNTDVVLQSYGFNGLEKTTPTIETMVPMGLGFEYKVNSNLFVDIDISMRVVNTDKLDGFITDNNSTLLQDMYGYTSLGLTYKFGDRSEPVKPVEAPYVAPVVAAVVDSVVKVDTVAAVDSAIVAEIPAMAVETVDSAALKADAEAQRLKEIQLAQELVLSTPSPIVEKPITTASQPTVVDGVSYQAVEVEQGLVYRIQIIAVQKQKDNKVAQLQRMYGINEVIYEEKVDTWYKYTVGSFATVDQALKYRLEIVNKGVKDAFIVPYYKGKRITNQQARDILSK